MEKLINTIRQIVNEELNELARTARLYKIKDDSKAKKIMDLYSKASGFEWVGDLVNIINKAGDTGISGGDVIETLYKEYKYNKTSQEINPIISRFIEDGIIDAGAASSEPKTKSEPGGQKGRPASEKTLVAKAVDQKLQADNDYQPNEDELAALGAEFIEKLRARVKGTLKRGRPANPDKASDGMKSVLKGLMNVADKDSDGEIDNLEDDFEDEDFLQENTLNESFTRMQKIAGLIK
jgi:hypothetical protein